MSLRAESGNVAIGSPDSAAPADSGDNCGEREPGASRGGHRDAKDLRFAALVEHDTTFLAGSAELMEADPMTIVGGHGRGDDPVSGVS